MQPSQPMRIVSYGGGVQSNALLVMAAEDDLDFTTFVFANTGDNAENPDTLDYVRNIAVPYAEAHGIELVELSWQWKDGRDWTLYDLLTNPESRSIGLPIRMSNGAPGNRACTVDFKIRVIARWMKEHGCTESRKGMTALGISVDGFQRARSASNVPVYDICYPLIDRRMDRQACQNRIARAGLPVPPKSSCYFCPFHSLAAWRELRDTKPALFQKSVELEQTLNQRRAALGRDSVWLTSRLVPLAEAVGPDIQPSLLEDTCESGYCMT